MKQVPLTSEMASWLTTQATKVLGTSTKAKIGENVGMAQVKMRSTKAIAENNGYEIEGYATTDFVDCDNEVILPDGLDWSAFKQYKTIYCDHMYAARYAVATFRWLKQLKAPMSGWALRSRLLPDNFSDEVPRMRMLAERDALGMSIGFVADEIDYPTAAEAKQYPGCQSIIRKASVFEVSYTTMPCNMSCRAQIVTQDDSKAAIVQGMITKGLLPNGYSGITVTPSEFVAKPAVFSQKMPIAPPPQKKQVVFLN